MRTRRAKWGRLLAILFAVLAFVSVFTYAFVQRAEARKQTLVAFELQFRAERDRHVSDSLLNILSDSIAAINTKLEECQH